MTNERFSLKDHLFNREKIAYLGGLLEAGIDDFDRQSFESAVMDQMTELELKQRIAHIADVLADHLDEDFAVACQQIERSLPPPLDPALHDDDFGDFIIAPLGKYVEDNGLDHYDASMGLLRKITMRFSMEGPIRPFINEHPEETLELFQAWARDDNYHVRRLVSEGTRPLLPWAPRIDLDVAAPVPLLDALHADPTRYVTRSVANHVNDISKIDPTLAVDTLGRWHAEGRQEARELEWMTRHGLRTLIKQGHPDAMGLLGYSTEPDITAQLVIATPVVCAGEALEFEVEIVAHSDEPLLVDYAIDLVKKNGTARPRVFKMKRIDLKAGQAANLSKSHRLRADATTYKLYPGTHKVTILVNGQALASSDFEVAVP